MLSCRKLVKNLSNSLSFTFDHYLGKEARFMIIAARFGSPRVVEQREGSLLTYPIRLSTVSRSILKIVGELLDGPQMVTEGLI